MPSLSGVAKSPGEFPPIDDLPNATTPLAGSEFAPISQGGVDKKVTIDNLTAGRSVSVATLVSGAGTSALPSVTTTGDLNTGAWFPAADTFAVSTGGAERMRINSSGNVGIGTESPTSKLDVYGGDIYVRLAGASASTLRGLRFSSDTTGVAFIRSNASTGELRIEAGFSGYGGELTYYTNGLERMRINSAGNVGIGAASPGISAPSGRALTIESSGINVFEMSCLSDSLSSGSEFVSHNFYAGSAKNLVAKIGVNIFGSSENSGILTLSTASAGTLTERMRIDSAGNVGIGTTSPSALLDVRGNGFCNNPNSGYTTTATSAGTTTLTSSSLRQQYFTGTTTQTVVLPVTSTLALGWKFEVCNNSTGNVTVQSSGSNTIRILGPNTKCIVTCILTSGTGVSSWSVNHDSFAESATYVNNQTGTTYTLALTDIGGTVTLSNASAITLTLPQTSNIAVPIGSRVKLVNLGVGSVTLVKEGAETLLGNTLLAQYATAIVEKLSATQWQVFAGTAVVTEQMSVAIVATLVNDKVYDIAVPNFSGTILGLSLRNTSVVTAGAYTAKINSTNITGLAAIANSATRTLTAATAANTFVSGDVISYTPTGTTSVVDAFITIQYTRQY